MIIYDRYTFAVINLLFFLGLLGLFKPTWFIILSRFPFIFPLEPREQIGPLRRRMARLWGGLSLLGAVTLLYFAPR